MGHPDRILCVDFETCSAVPISAGAAAYSEHDSTRLWCASFASALSKNEKPSTLSWVPGMTLDPRIAAHVRGGGLLLAHNAGFEQHVWHNILTPRFGWPEPKIEQWRDTQAAAALANLPITLEGLASVFKGSPGKDMKGNALMRSMAKVTVDRDGHYHYPGEGEDPGEFKAKLDRLIAYCEADVLATLFVWWRLPRMSNFELDVWHEDQRINRRGVAIDLEFVDAAARMADRRKGRLARDVFRITGALCANSTSTPALKAWLAEEGVDLPVVARKNTAGEMVASESLSKDTVNALLAKDDIDGAVRAVLDNRVEANKATSLAKLKRVPSMVSADGRLRGALRYAIAHTGRWASSGIQVHNLPKDKRKSAQSEHVRRMIRTGNLDGLLMTEERPLDAISQSLRSMIVASPDHDLIGADYSAIEARVVAWLAGHTEALSIFERGEDIYVAASAALYGKPAALVTKEERQLGKVCTLALGYGMGVLKFIDTARREPYNVVLNRKEAFRVQRAWRASSEPIVRFWSELEQACHAAVENRGQTLTVGRLVVGCDDRCLMIRLPSGRAIRYWQPRIKRVTKRIASVNEDGEIVENEFETMELQFFTVGKDKTRMARESTYGGKLVENVTQAVARDLLAHALLKLAAAGFATVLHVHDSIVAEVEAGTRTVEEFCYWMTDRPSWAIDCPITAEGYRAKVFKG